MKMDGTIHCCRRDGGPPIVLKALSASTRWTSKATTKYGNAPAKAVRVSADELELALSRRLRVSSSCTGSDEEDRGNNEEDDLQYMPRYDVHWLGITEQPPNYELETILGIPEDLPARTTTTTVTTTTTTTTTANNGNEKNVEASLEVEVVCFEATVDDSSSSTSTNGTTTHNSSQPGWTLLGGPHSEWRRREAISTNDGQPETGTSKQNDVDVDVDNNDDRATLLWWMDMRRIQPRKQPSTTTLSNSRNTPQRPPQDVDAPPLVSTQADVVQMLRSILTSKHDASPWVTNSREEEEEGSDSPSAHQAQPDIVMLVLDEPIPVLKEFRVSDVAPSWFLHGMAHMDDLEDSKDLFGLGLDKTMMTMNGYGNSLNNGHAKSVLPPAPRRHCEDDVLPATLLIYKRLGHRSGLFIHHPVSGPEDRTLNVCLWEAYNDDDNDAADEKERVNGDHHTRRCYRLTSPPYLNLEQEYLGTSVPRLFSSESIRVFLKDALSIPHWTPWPETAHYRVSSDDPNAVPWTVFPLCHCFPANQPQNLTWVSATRSYVPETCRLLEGLVGRRYLRTALFSQLAPHSVLEAHTGWSDLANHVLRLHVPLVVPSQDEGLCGTWVDGCVETHREGRSLLFDDSKIHRAFNYSDETRIVLIVDLARPDDLPLGTATGGHSDELDAFIQKMGLPR